MRHVEAGDYVSHLRSFQGGFEHASLPGRVSAAYTVLKPRVELNSSYFKYLFKSSAYIQALQTTTDQLRDGQSIRYEQFKLIPLPFPTYAEQSAIACVLDGETAEIDAFIADQEELVGLLAERRSATISHAVTKGLDPNAPMKDSGMEWTGRVPGYWDMRKLGALFSRIGSGTTPTRENPDFYGSGTPWVTTSELREETIYATKEEVTDLALRTHSALQKFPAGSLLIAMYGATVGRLGVLGVEATMNQACCGLSQPRSVASKYAYYALVAAREHLLAIADGAGQPNISQAKLRQLQIPVPPINEQHEIVEYLDLETAEVDATIADTRQAIALSLERRAALISAAVTGKIDVRDRVRETA